MVYRPSVSFRLWDTWIFPAEDIIHLFHLQKAAGGPSMIGHAVSTDLVHWNPCDPIPTQGPPGTWDTGGGGLTGMVIRHGDGYAMTYGSTVNVLLGRAQQIGIMFSSDLYQWKKCAQNPVLKAVSPYMHQQVRYTEGIEWRDAYLLRVDRGYEALICARMPDGRACIARMQSKDLIHWRPLAPMATPPVFQCEVPEYFSMGDKHYLIFSCGGFVIASGGGGHGRLLDEKSRKDTIGTYYLVSDSRTGEYLMPEDSLLLGSGNGRFDCYVGRTIVMKGQRMLYHHNWGSRPSLGAPKVIRQSEDGSLWLQYWDELSRLETGVVLNRITAESEREKDWKLVANRLVGHKDEGISISTLSPILSDFNLSCTVRIEEGKQAAVVFRYDEKTDKGLALTVNAQSGKVEIAAVEKGQISTRDAVLLGIRPSEEHTIRIFARSEFADCYVDDKLVFSTVVDDAPLSGKVGFAVDSAIVSFSNLRVASLESE